MADITQAEATGAITDLLMTIMLIPFVLYLFRVKKGITIRKPWLEFIVFLTISTFLGFVAHYYCKGLVFKLVWIPLYISMLMAVNDFLILALSSCDRNTLSARRITNIASLLTFAAVEYIEFCLDKSAIRLYTVYAFIVGLTAFGFLFLTLSGIETSHRK